MPNIQRFIPESADVRELPDANLTVYVYTNAAGSPAYVAYKGRRAKAVEHYRFESVTKLEACLAELVKRERESFAFSHARKTASHGLSIGDVLVSSWGYEQTNIDFYEVVRVPSNRSVVLRQIAAETPQYDAMAMSGYKTPKPGVFISGEAMHRATGEGSVSGGSRWRGGFHKWNGKPQAFTTYA